LALNDLCLGAAVSVAASMNLSRVRSPACTSVVSRPCADAKLGPVPGLSLSLDVVVVALEIAGRAHGG
jgi:hypothetical protein